MINFSKLLKSIQSIYYKIFGKWEYEYLGICHSKVRYTPHFLITNVLLDNNQIRIVKKIGALYLKTNSKTRKQKLVQKLEDKELEFDLKSYQKDKSLVPLFRSHEII